MVHLIVSPPSFPKRVFATAGYGYDPSLRCARRADVMRRRGRAGREGKKLGLREANLTLEGSTRERDDGREGSDGKETKKSVRAEKRRGGDVEGIKEQGKSEKIERRVGAGLRFVPSQHSQHLKRLPVADAARAPEQVRKDDHPLANGDTIPEREGTRRSTRI